MSIQATSLPGNVSWSAGTTAAGVGATLAAALGATVGASLGGTLAAVLGASDGLGLAALVQAASNRPTTAVARVCLDPMSGSPPSRDAHRCRCTSTQSTGSESASP